MKPLVCRIFFRVCTHLYENVCVYAHCPTHPTRHMNMRTLQSFPAQQQRELVTTPMRTLWLICLLLWVSTAATSIASHPSSESGAWTRLHLFQTARDTGDRLAQKADVQLSLDASTPSTGGNVAVLHPETSYQRIQGFGGAFTEAAAINFFSMPVTQQQSILEAYFGKTGNRYSLCRVHMNSCDFCVSSYSEDDIENDYALLGFNIRRDKEHLVPFIQAAMNYSSLPINIFLSPWSPPAWMKSNGAMDGSNQPGLKNSTLVHASWALFYSKFIDAYKKEGINLWGLTVQNEPLFAAPWEACYYSAEDELNFLKSFLGPEIRYSHPDVKIYIFDHNKDEVYDFANTILSDPVARNYVDGTAFHWYAGDHFPNLDRLHQAHPDKLLLATEGCEGPGVILDDWSRGEHYGRDIMGDLQSYTTGWVDWNMVLDMQGGPNHLHNYCDAPVIVDQKKGDIHLQIPYYYMGHFSRFLPPGSIHLRMDTSQLSGVELVAFQLPSGDLSIVALNLGDSTVTFTLVVPVAGKPYSAPITVPSHSIITLTSSDGW